MKKFKIEELVKLNDDTLNNLSSNLLWKQQDQLFDKASEAVDKFIGYKNYSTDFNEEKFYELRDYANKCIKDKLYMYYNQNLIHEAITLKKYGEEEDDYDYYPEYYASVESWKEHEGKRMVENLNRELIDELITDDPNKEFSVKLTKEQFDYIFNLAEDIIPFGYLVYDSEYIIRLNTFIARQMKNLLKSHDEDSMAIRLKIKIDDALYFN
jgi:hypothetical protein